MFPQGLFYILSRKHGFALDVYDGQTKEDANLIVWPQKFQDSDNQLWSFDNGRLTNKKSGHVMDISSSAFKKDKTIVQKKRKPSKQSQEWIYENGFICSKEYPSLVLDIRGDSPKGGAQVLLYKRKDTDNLNQLWQFEPYQQFENALHMATTSIPLHKKEGFGQPRPGYAAEPGVPPELKTVPQNNKIAGVGNNVSPSPTTTGPGNSRVDPVLAQYGSFYGGSTTAPPPAQPGQAPSSHQYPPPPPQGQGQAPSSSQYPPPPQGQGQGPSSSQYPPPPAPNNDYPQSNQAPPSAGFPQAIPTASAYPPPPSNNNSSGYPQPQQQQQQPYPAYPPPTSPLSSYQQPPSPSNYRPAASGSGYPGSPPAYPSQSQSSYPPAPSGYPPAPNQHELSTSPTSGYPPSNYPPSNNASGYPASPTNYPPGNNFYQQQEHHQQQQQNQPSMPTAYKDNDNNYGYPPAGAPPLPGNRPGQQQDQYGYPTYPQ